MSKNVLKSPLIKKVWLQLQCRLSRGQQVLYQRWIWGIHCMQVGKHQVKDPPSLWKPRAEATKSPKQGYQWSHKKNWGPPKCFKKYWSKKTCKFFFKWSISFWLHAQNSRNICEMFPLISIVTGRNEVVAKVMFLQVCVCPRGGEGVCLSACWDSRPPQTRQTPLDQADPPGPGRHPPDQADTPQTRQTPPTPQTR